METVPSIEVDGAVELEELTSSESESEAEAEGWARPGDVEAAAEDMAAREMELQVTSVCFRLFSP